MNRRKLFYSKSLRSLIMIVGLIYIGVFSASAQKTVTVTGSVTDVSGAIVSGVNVTVKGTTIGSLTNDEGKYSVNVPASATLVFSLLGYATQEIAVGNKTVVDAVLVESSEMIDDVVVVGYGSQRKATLTGAVAALTSEDLVKTKTGNLQNALTGRVTGVRVNQRTSQPGTFTTDFNIRGMGTPLIVVDGVPRQTMERMDENEIESVSVLKDASAAIYGSRAANGVVLITTKKGKASKKFNFEYNGYMGVQNMMLNVELMDAVQFMRMYNEKRANSGEALIYSEEDINAYMNGTKKSTDWLAETVKENPMVQQHSVNASGSSGMIDYFTNFGYFYQDGWFKSDNLNYKRFNLRSNVTARLTDNLKAEIFLNMITDRRNAQAESTWRVINRGVYLTPPIYPVYYNNDPTKPLSPPVGNNPVFLTRPESGYNYNIERAINTNISLEYAFPGVKGLTAKGMYSYDYTEDEWKIFRKGYNEYLPNGTVSWTGYNPLQRVWWGGVNTLMQLSLNYNNTFKDVHSVSATLVYEESDREADNISAQRNVVLGALDQLFAASRTGEATNQYTGKVSLREDGDEAYKDGLYHYANKGLVGKVAYAYDSKYLLDVSFRYDGSSRFAPGHQWGFFPAVSGGWVLSKESFISETSLNFINNLKLRASLGQMGNEGTSTYQFVTGYNYGSVSYLFGDNNYIAGARALSLPNPLITWSTATVTDIGIDAEFWNGKLGIVADIYQRHQTGLLANRAGTLPGVVGASMPQENLNSNLTRGFEFAVSHRSAYKDFKYNVSAGIFMSRTKNLHIEEAPALDSYDKWRNKNTDRWEQIVWGVNQIGQFQSFDEIFNSGISYGSGNAYVYPGDFINEDWNGDGVIDAMDDHPIAINTNYSYGVKPLLNYHISLGGEWKGFDLNLLLQGAGMAKRSYASERDNRSDQFRGIGNRDANGFTIWYDRWHRADETNPSKWQEWVPGKYPSLYQSLGTRDGNITKMSDFWTWNTAYLRLKSVELGYTLPSVLTQKIGINSLRIFVNSYNTLTWSNMPIGDPEVKNGDEYPLNRTFSLGINLKF